MIHYTLLPEKQIRALKREYRVRLLIFLLFFMSCSILVGVLSLTPAFVSSYLEEKGLMNMIILAEKNKKVQQTGNLIKDFSKSNEMVKRLKENKSSIIFSDIISNIITYKPQGLSIRSFSISEENTTGTSTIVAIIQGKSSSRETLVLFKDRLESDPLVSKVELPVSDLVKSKDISYSIKVSFIQIPL